MNKRSRIVSGVAAAVLAAVAAGQLGGCAVAVIGGAAGAGALIVTAGRRSSETAAADSRIEGQVRNAIEEALAGRDHHIVVTSYYRRVLLTGEVTSDADRARAQALAQGAQGVEGGVVNDLAVMPPSSAFSRSQDAYITSKVKTRFMHTNGVPAAAIKVLTERGTVYLMGRLTRQEAQAATSAVQQVDGVQRVARVIDFVSDSDVVDGSTSTVTGGSNADVPASGGVNDVTVPEPAPAPAPAPGVETHPIR